MMTEATAAASADRSTMQPPPIPDTNKNISEEEQPASSSPLRKTKRMHLSPEKTENDDMEEVNVALARPLTSASPLKSYHCPACKKKNMPGDKLKEHFLTKHKDFMTSANANGANEKSMGTWNETECQTFEAGCIIFGWGKWLSIATLMSTRDRAQIKSHAQKFQIHRNKEYQELIAYHSGDDLSDNNSTKSSVGGYDSVTSSNTGGSSSWTEEEREQFKMGVVINGWGSWTEIAKNVPTKTTAQIRNRAMYIKGRQPDEETRLRAEHAKLVSRNPQLYSGDYVRRVTESAAVVKPQSPKSPPQSQKSNIIITDRSDSRISVSNTKVESRKHAPSPPQPPSTYAEGMWSVDEHAKFEKAVIEYGWGDWVSVTAQIPTRDKKQVKSHAQKFDLHHPGGKDRLQREHKRLEEKQKKLAGAKRKSVEKKINAEKVKKKRTEVGKTADTGMKVVDDKEKNMEEGKNADVAMEIRENVDATCEEEGGDKMEVEQLDDTNNQEKQKSEEDENSSEEKMKDDEKKEDDEEARTTSSDESRQQQQLRVSPRVVKAPRDNYIDSLQKDQWQRKKKDQNGQDANDSANGGGVRQRNDGLYGVRIWYARKWCNIGNFDSEALAQVAHRIASGILQPETTPNDPAAVEWNIKIARDAAVDGAKLAERDAEGGGEGGILEPPKAIQNYLLGGHIVSAGEQTIKHQLFATATATKTEINLAHFTVTCSNGPIHVDVGTNDSLFDLRRKIFDQFDSSQLDDANCNFNFQVDTNMVSRKVECSFIARDLLQLGKSVELIPRSAVLSGESSQDVSTENGVTNHNYAAGEEDDDDEEDLTTFYETSAPMSKLMNWANEIAIVTPASAGSNPIKQAPKVDAFLQFLKESSTLAGNIDSSYFTELEYVYKMEKTGLHEKQVEKWISDAKNRFVKPMESVRPESQIGTPSVDSV